MSTPTDPGAEPLAQFFRQSREAMYITRRDGLILQANQALGDLLGYAPQQLEGLPISQVLDPGEDRERYQDRIENQGAVHDYPVVRMGDMPVVEVVLVTSSEAPGGIGEPITATTGPSIANAVFNATGKRVRRMPITSEDLKGA